jgi:hypothetical protein
MSKQLLLFEEKVEEKILREFELLKEKYEKNRKSLHAKNGELQRKYDEITHRLNIFEAMVCSGKINHMQ